MFPDIEKTVRLLLETYSLEEILEMNDLTEEDLVEELLYYNVIKLPEILPVDEYV